MRFTFAGTILSAAVLGAAVVRVEPVGFVLFGGGASHPEDVRRGVGIDPGCRGTGEQRKGCVYFILSSALRVAEDTVTATEPDAEREGHIDSSQIAVALDANLSTNWDADRNGYRRHQK